MATTVATFLLIEAGGYPHFEYPQFKQVWHPSISTSAFVLHLAHKVAPGGNPLLLSPSAAGSAAATVGAALTSEFFFAAPAS